MKLDKMNETWKRRVNTGAHGRAIRLDVADGKKVNRKFWKPIKEYVPGRCETGNGNGPYDGQKELTLGPVKLELFGPKSKKGRYVCVATYVRCVSDPDIVITGVGDHPVMPED